MAEDKAVDDGGPAFPRQPTWLHNETGGNTWCQDAGEFGMTLRDYFAAKALQGMLASDSSVDRTKVNKQVWAGVAYEFADAMLNARAR